MIFSDRVKLHHLDNTEGFGLCSVGVAIIGASAIGAGASIYSAGKAADAQRDAANSSINAQMQMYNRMRSDLSPYIEAGTQTLGDLQSQLPYLTSQVKPLDAAGLENLPGYQFTRDQGLRAAQNALTSTGLGRSGAAVKAADRFNTGLAQQTYNTQANYVTNLDLANRQNTYNRLMGIVGVGQNAAAGVGNAGVQTGQGVGNAFVGAGNASAAGYNAMGQAVGNAASGAASGYGFNQLMNNNNSSGGLYNAGSNPGWFPSNAWYNQ